MPDFTTNLNLAKPLVNSATDQDLWGGQLNGDMDILDAEAALWSIAKNANGKVLSNAVLKTSREMKSSPSSSSGTLTLDFTNGNHFTTTLTENISTLSITSVPTGTVVLDAILVVKQDGTGSRTFTWPAAAKGALPVITSTASRADVFVLISFDNFTSFIVSTVQQNVSGLGI